MRRVYTVVFEIDQVWIDDGFDLSDSEAKDMLWERLPWANDHEIDAHVVDARDEE